jgi:polyisoprenoid-binding protein YceI
MMRDGRRVEAGRGILAPRGLLPKPRAYVHFTVRGHIMTVQLAAAILAFALAMFADRAAAEQSYTLDPLHSQPRYEIQHMRGLSTQIGYFTKMNGKVTLDRAAKKGTIDVTIDTTSIRTHDPSRLDAIVKGEQYFNVEKYPTMSFKSTNLVFDGDKVVGAEGELTMIGVTKPVSLKVANFVCGENPFNKKPMCGGEAMANIKRSEWGMKAGIPMSSGDDVKIVIPIEAYLDGAG